MAQDPVIAIDGPAGAGKSTVARAVARRLGAAFLDTGALYRTVAWAARNRGIAWDRPASLADVARSIEIRFEADGEGGQRVLCDGEDVSKAIRTPEISAGASQVSAHEPVRAALLELQRAVAGGGLVVAEGRDMGTVVFPAARLKVFLTADVEIRARRRFEELCARGLRPSFDEVLREQQARDEADRSRAVAPLRRADDAVLLDTTGLSVDEVVDRIVELAGR